MLEQTSTTIHFFSSHFEQVVTVESNPLAHKVLKINCESTMNVRIFEIALGDSKSKSLLINHNANFANGHLAKFHKDEIVTVNDRTFTIAEVEVSTLDDFLNQELLKPEIVKIDTEGSELDILKGGEIYFTEKSPIVLVELAESTFIDFRKNIVIEQLKLYGYTDFAIADYAIPTDEHLSFEVFCLNLLKLFYKKNYLKFNWVPYPKKGAHRIVIAVSVNRPFSKSKL